MRLEYATFMLTKRDLAALLAFAAKDQCRPNLEGVAFEPREGRCYSTDGHTAVIARNCGREPDAASYIIGRGPLEAACKACSNKGSVAVTASEGRWRIDVRGAEGETVSSAEGATVAATPVPIDAVTPALSTDAPRTAWAANAHYIARLALVAKACAAERVECQLGEDGMAPARFDAFDVAAGTAWTALVMPMRPA